MHYKNLTDIRLSESEAGFVSRMPKVELHVHLEGSLKPSTVLELYDSNGISVPFKHEASLVQSYRYSHFSDFSRAFTFSAGCLRKPQDFFRAVVELGASLSTQNVKYVEVNWTPQFYFSLCSDMNAVLEAMNDARDKVYKESGLVMQWIVDLIRSAPRMSAKSVSWMLGIDWGKCNIVAFGLGGPEVGHPAGRFASLAAVLQKTGLPCNPHAGEAGDPESVWESIRCLQPRRIGHGIRSSEDPALVRYLATSGIGLEICLSSNIALGLSESVESHPLARLVKSGVNVSINTDDPALFQTDLTTEYMLAVSSGCMSLAQLVCSVRAAILSAYLPLPRRLMLLSEFDQEIHALSASYGIPALAGF